MLAWPCVFGKQSLLPFPCDLLWLRAVHAHHGRLPLSRSYGVNLPSSFSRVVSSTLGYSPRPPVSVYGTGCFTLNDLVIFSQVWLPALSSCPKTPGTVRFQPKPTPFNVLFRQHAAVSLPGLTISCKAGGGILTASSSGSPFGLPLVPGLP